MARFRGSQPGVEKVVPMNFNRFARPFYFTLSVWMLFDRLLSSILSCSTDELRSNATWKCDLMLIFENVIAKDTIDINATVGKDLVLIVFGSVPVGRLYSISFPPVIRPVASAVGLCGADKDRRVVIRDVRGQLEGIVREVFASRFYPRTQAPPEDFIWRISAPMNQPFRGCGDSPVFGVDCYESIGAKHFTWREVKGPQVFIEI